MLEAKFGDDALSSNHTPADPFLGTPILRKLLMLFIFHRHMRFVDLLIVVINIAL